MRVKRIASLLICVVVLAAVSPSKALAQTAGRTAVAAGEQALSAGRVGAKARLKDAFAGEVEKGRDGKISREELKRLEAGWLSPQSAPKSHSFNKKAVIFTIVVVVVITAIAIVLEHNGVNPVTNCQDDPTVPDCVP